MRRRIAILLLTVVMGIIRAPPPSACGADEPACTVALGAYRVALSAGGAAASRAAHAWLAR